VLPALAPLAGAMELRLVRGDEGRTSELLREGAVVAAVTAEAEPVAGCVVVPLGSMRYRPACTPAFAERWFPDGPTADALARAPVVSFDPDDPLQQGYITRHAHPGAAPPTHMIPSSIDHVAAIRLGVGWGMLADLLAGDEHAGAPLVDLDPDGVVDVPLYWQHWRLRSPSLETLTRIMVAAARGSLRG
jgi:LysR family transcriptional regulator (chromosome initiation inhibitor)